MTIRFKCPHCTKGLAVKDELAGRRGACPACKKALVIPAPQGAAVDVEALAAAALAEEPREQAPEPVAQPIKFTCAFCDEEAEFPADMAGKKAPCPSCKRIIKVPELKADKPKDWRELIKKGPSAALINQPEQLEGAWGTEVKTRVSGGALEEAGAIIEVVEPVGWLGWAKRGVGAMVLVGIVLGGWTALNRRASDVEKKGALDVALGMADPKKNAVKLAPLVLAEIHRGAGIIYLRDNKGEAAQREFRTALAYLRTELTEDSGDFDLSLIDLALAQCELGGDKDQILTKVRFDWQRDVQQDLDRTLHAVRNTEARVWAIRVLSTKLLEMKQGNVALGLATSLAGGDVGRSPIIASQVALLLARDDAKAAKAAEKQLPLPDLKNDKAVLDPLARVAYVEGHARRGQFAQAKDLALFRGADRDRLEACLAAGSIAAGHPKNKAQALDFFKAGLTVFSAMVKDRPTAWQHLQLANLGLAAEAPDDAKELAKSLPPNYRTRWQLEKVRWELARASGSVPATLVEEVADEKSSARALAWCLLARHQARVGRRADVASAAAELTDPAIRALVHLGLALGEQDSRQ